MAYSFEDDVALGPRRSSSEAPYEQSRSKAALRALLIGLAASSKVRPGAGPLASFGTGALYGHEQKTAAEKAATDYAMKQMQAQQAEEDRTIRNRYIEAQMKKLESEKPEKADKPDQTVVTTVGPDGQPVYTLRSDAVGKKAYVAPRQEGLIAIVGSDGKPTLVPQSQAKGATPASGAEKPPDATARAMAGILTSVAGAETSIRAQEDRVSKKGFLDAMALQKLPSAALSGEDQQYIQGADWWIENVLRQASGAVINVDEYPTYRKIYFAQPGDKPGTVTQKRKSREKIQEKFRIMAGTAAKGIPSVPSGGDVEWVLGADGKLVRQ